jgi:hypothetical protein
MGRINTAAAAETVEEALLISILFILLILSIPVNFFLF